MKQDKCKHDWKFIEELSHRELLTVNDEPWRLLEYNLYYCAKCGEYRHKTVEKPINKMEEV